MGKSAQVPLHVWLPDSMEGPTPISALIHAATMVTAGIFMVARMSPLFEYSETALSFVLVIGATTALFMGFLGIVNNDIKRVIAYSTLSQLGYMTVALGVSAYSVAIFHLMTHAFFKALLFLAAGAVIIAHAPRAGHAQDGRPAKRMPVTYWTCLIGALALIGTPFFSGFYSKDALIEAVGESHRAGAGYAYFCVLAGVFVTAFYTFRMIFMTFHGKSRLDHHAEEHFHDVRLGHEGAAGGAGDPVAADRLSSPSGRCCSAATSATRSSCCRAERRGRRDRHGSSTGRRRSPMRCRAHAAVLAGGRRRVRGLVLRAAATRSARTPSASGLAWLYGLLDNKYYFDWFNENVIARASRGLGTALWRGGDQALIDGVLVNGSAGFVGWIAGVARRVQSGYLYSYAFWMIIGLVAAARLVPVRALRTSNDHARQSPACRC